MARLAGGRSSAVEMAATAAYGRPERQLRLTVRAQSGGHLPAAQRASARALGRADTAAPSNLVRHTKLRTCAKFFAMQLQSGSDHNSRLSSASRARHIKLYRAVMQLDMLLVDRPVSARRVRAARLIGILNLTARQAGHREVC